MPILKLIYGDFEKQIDVKSNTNLLEAIHTNGIFIDAPCGGHGLCNKCTVIINGKSCLACKISINDDLTVFIPEYNTLTLEDKNQQDIKNQVKNIEPAIIKVNIPIDHEQRNNYQSDIDFFKNLLKQKKYNIENPGDSNLLNKIQSAAHSKNNYSVFLLQRDNQYKIIDIQPGEIRNLGIAIDIGTTTISLVLIDTEKAKVIDSLSFYNPQIMFGADIIHRIIYSLKNNGAETLKEKLVAEINQGIHSLLIKNYIQPDEVKSIAIAGNTTMIHLLLGLNAKYIRETPYSPVANVIPSFENNLFKSIKNTRIFIIPGVANYLGGDITAGVIACGMNKDEKLSILLDIGTNGEIVVGSKDWLAGCACSAGPAFEGMGLNCGTRYKQGAITGVNFKEGKFEYLIAGNTKPSGISGTGIISLIKHLRAENFIDKRGKFTDKVNDKIGNRKAFIIFDKTETANNEYIYIDEIDIDNILRAKAAIYAGAKIILKKLSLDFSNIDAFYIAGGIGNSLNIDDALDIGLFPNIEKNKIKFIGNSSLNGAVKFLISEQARLDCESLANTITYIDLSSEASYMDEFMAALFIPHTDY